MIKNTLLSTRRAAKPFQTIFRHKLEKKQSRVRLWVLEYLLSLALQLYQAKRACVKLLVNVWAKKEVEKRYKSSPFHALVDATINYV